MKSALEFNGMAAQWNPETLAVHSNSVPVAPGNFVTVCAWCDAKKDLTRALWLAGYTTSHGCCQKCHDDFLAKMKN